MSTSRSSIIHQICVEETRRKKYRYVGRKKNVDVVVPIVVVYPEKVSFKPVRKIAVYAPGCHSQFFSIIVIFLSFFSILIIRCSFGPVLGLC